MNVFGNRQHPEKYIPSTIRKVRDGKLVTIHSDATKLTAGSRHYIHTSDVSEAILFLLKLLIELVIRVLAMDTRVNK